MGRAASKPGTGRFFGVFRAGSPRGVFRAGSPIRLYKEKGPRYLMKNYRPIGVTSVLYRILSKVMVIAIQPLLKHVVIPLQAAFQDGR